MIEFQGGRHPSDPTAPKLRLKSVLRAGYTGQVPASVSYSSKVAGWPMYGNDRLGDCTAAAAGHVEEVFSTYGQGALIKVTDQAVIDFYSGSTGYVPGQPSTDQGGTMDEVLKFWRTTGLDGHKIAAFFAVDPTDADEVRAALWLFGNCYVGMMFPDTAMDQFNAGKPWTVQRRARNEGGHCVSLTGAVKGGNYEAVTWGRTQQVDQTFFRTYMDEVYCVVSLEWARSGLIPNGLDVDAANAAFQELTGEPGPFATLPAPPVGPTPTPAVDDTEFLKDVRQRLFDTAQAITDRVGS